ncbi:TMEM175 family protein [Candidatus Enterococcus leclercqii]|uniref:TMEM175 family protein n=1 Tax=Candidatus Enterococcus leclercqii TaxID=1857218 RepID=UPI001379C1FD|nr:TMEM175 family protein [Enterococcus sp. CU9D]KAF1293903.1 hypothetical protein BAU14_11685 [Enterococcus sp. CU9D]
MKERVTLFSDAVIAIILTVMVVEFPVKVVNGHIQLAPLFMTIGIYFISFCFVANIWFQTAQRFNKVTEVTNKDLVIYLMSLFLLSLVPKATDVLIEETSQSTLMMYGVLTLFVVFLTELLLNTLTKQAVQEKQTPKEEIDNVRRRGIALIASRILLLIVGLFFPRFSLIVYMILPVLDFLQNAVDHEETEFLQQMGTDQREFYQEDPHQVWQNNWQKYGTLLRTALAGRGDGAEDDPSQQQGERPDWWQSFDRKWQQRLTSEQEHLTQRLKSATDENEIAALKTQLQRLDDEQEAIDHKLSATQERFKKRQDQEQQRLWRHLQPIQTEMTELETALQQETDPKTIKKLNSQLQNAKKKYQEELSSSQDRTRQNVQQAHARLLNISKKHGPRPKKTTGKNISGDTSATDSNSKS